MIKRTMKLHLVFAVLLLISTPAHSVPVAVIEADVSDAVAPYSARLLDVSISNDDRIVSREWDIDNDGIPDSGAKRITVPVEAPGSYPVSLTVTDKGGASDTTTLILYGRTDLDGDGVADNIDNCPNDINSNQ